MLALTAFALMVLAQQQTTPPVTPPDVNGLPLNLTLAQWVMLMFGGVGVAALGRNFVALFTSLVGMVKSYSDSFPKRLEGDLKAKEVDTSEREEFTELMRQFREALTDNQTANLKFAETITETQRLSNEQRQQFNDERKAWEAKMVQLVDEIKVKDTALEALAKENLELKAEIEQLKLEKAQLEERLKKFDTGQHAAVVPPTDPPTTPSDEPKGDVL